MILEEYKENFILIIMALSLVLYCLIGPFLEKFQVSPNSPFNDPKRLKYSMKHLSGF